MTASSDKVQHYLEQSLEQSLPLVHRGIFSQSELQGIMSRRQKCQHSMLKTTYQKTDYLSAIEYEYQLQRERRKRMVEMSKLQQGSNPLFRKQNGSDYAIVKRIIRLWDRTMHKFKFELSLWKQYLSFTIAINSKKHFYKALTQAIRFLPFQIDLWKIGAAYEMEKGLNMWKGRRLIFKGLKMVPQGQRNIELSHFMVEYEIYFLRRLVQRKNILIKGDAPLKFIGVDENEVQSNQDKQQQDHEPEVIDLSSYDQVIWLVIEESFSKNCNSNNRNLTFTSIKEKFRELLVRLKREEPNMEIKTILTKVVGKLNAYDGQGLPEKAKQVKQEQEIKLQGTQEQNRINTISRDSKDINDWKENIFRNGNIDWTLAEKGLKTFCLKPEKITDLYSFLLSIDPEKTVHFILTRQGSKRIPSGTLFNLIDMYLKERGPQEVTKVITSQIDRWVTPEDLRKGGDLFSKICLFNKKENRFQSTTRILRSLSINYRHQPQYLAHCNTIAGSH